MNKQGLLRRRMAGFSLMEVLVALVVLSVGLLGLAALQAEGLRGSSTAQFRFQAVRLMGDIVDRMRANRAGLASYAVGTGGAGTDNDCSEDASTATAANCTAAQMAAHDIWLWKADLLRLLRPAGNGSVVAVAGATNRFNITVSWTERGDAMTIAQEVQF